MLKGLLTGCSAFGVNKTKLIAESMKATKKSGEALFSSYSPKILLDRLGWFRMHSQRRLIGEIDEEKTRDGMIV